MAHHQTVTTASDTPGMSAPAEVIEALPRQPRAASHLHEKTGATRITRVLSDMYVRRLRLRGDAQWWLANGGFGRWTAGPLGRTGPLISLEPSLVSGLGAWQTPRVTDAEIARLIAQLGDGSGDVAEEAKAELVSMGAIVVEPLMAAVTSLPRIGQLLAIEIFDDIGDAAAGAILTQMLASEHATVREWSALALAHLDVREAVSALQAAYRRQRASGDGPDFTEAVGIRRALTMLGARRAVVPPLTASLRVQVASLGQSWPAGRLAEVINELAGSGQVVLYLQVWEVTSHGVCWQRHERLDQERDWDAPWARLVADAREAALLEAEFIPRCENLVATVEWIDESDR